MLSVLKRVSLPRLALFIGSRLPAKPIVVSNRGSKLIRDSYVKACLGKSDGPHPLVYNSTEVNYLRLIYGLEKAVYKIGYLPL